MPPLPKDDQRLPSLEPLVLTTTAPKRELTIATDLRTGGFELTRDGKPSKASADDLPKLHQVVKAFGGEEASGQFLEWLSKRAALMVAVRRALAAKAHDDEEE